MRDGPAANMSDTEADHLPHPLSSVQDLATRMNASLRTVAPVRVRAMVGKVVLASSGHMYFEIRDATARVSCVAWRGSVEHGTVVPGLAILDIARVEFYAPLGRCQAVVRAARVVSNAPTSKAMTLSKLHGDGLVDRPRLPIPDIVHHVCLITSSGSAAAGDLMAGIQQRWPGLRTTLIHTSVQGSDAPAQIVAAFKAARALSPHPDVIICGRGGGSEFDLAAFDTDAVARAFVGNDVATISAVGHEDDHAVTDVVADFRAKTPTAAVEIAIPVSLVQRSSALTAAHMCLCDAMSTVLRRARMRMASVSSSLLAAVGHGVQMSRASLTVTVQTMCRKPEQLLVKLNANLATARRALQHASRQCQQSQQRKLSTHATQAEAAVCRTLAVAAGTLLSARTCMHKHALPETWRRGFFTVYRTLANGKRMCLSDASQAREGEELRVLGAGGIMVVTVQSVA